MTIETGEVSTPDQGGSAGSEGGGASFEHGNPEPSESEHVEGGEPQAYAPNYKFKYYDQEGEFDDWVRDFIKDKETEDRFRGLYAKSHGFDVLKDRFKASRGEYDQLKTTHGELESKYKELDGDIDELIWQRDNDLHAFFDSWKVPVDRVIGFVEQYLDSLELPKEKQEELTKQRAVLAEKRQLEKQVNQFNQEKQTASIENHKEEFFSLIEHPEVADFAARFDERAGGEGSFAQAVIKYGDSHFKATGESLSPIEAIRAVYKQYKPFLGGAGEQRQASRAEAPMEQSREPAEVPKRPKPVPSLGGSSVSSPTKKVYKSLDDLKKQLKSMQDED